MNQKKSELDKILPEIIVDGIDYSLITMQEIKYFHLYGKIRQGLSQSYPNPHPKYEDDTIDIPSAKQDSRADLFLDSLTKVKQILDKIEKLKILANDYEIACARLYCKYLLNLMCFKDLKSRKRQKELKQFVNSFTDTDLYEIVESYFKVIRKYGLPTFEEPYYWLSTKRRREIRHTGEMLKRSTMFDDAEIQISLLEELF